MLMFMHPFVNIMQQDLNRLTASLACSNASSAAASDLNIRLFRDPASVELARLSVTSSVLHCCPLLKPPLLLALSRVLLPSVIALASGTASDSRAAESPAGVGTAAGEVLGALYPLSSRSGFRPSAPMGMACSGTLALVLSCNQYPADPLACEAASECLAQILMAGDCPHALNTHSSPADHACMMPSFHHISHLIPGCNPHPVLQQIAATTLSAVASMTEVETVVRSATELRKLVLDLACAEAVEGLKSLLLAQELSPETLFYTCPSSNLWSPTCRACALLPMLLKVKCGWSWNPQWRI